MIAGSVAAAETAATTRTASAESQLPDAAALFNSTFNEPLAMSNTPTRFQPTP